MAGKAPTPGVSDDIIHREMLLRSQDLILVYNPTEYDHIVNWNKARGGVSIVIPNRKRTVNNEYRAGYNVVPAYYAWQYCKEMVDIILNAFVVQEINKENARRTDVPGGQPLSIEGEGSDRHRYEERIRNEHKELIWVEFDAMNPVQPPSNNPKNAEILKLLKYRVIKESGEEPEVQEVLTPEKTIDLKALFNIPTEASVETQEEVKSEPAILATN